MQRACSSSSRFHLGGEQTPAFNARLNGVGVAFCNVTGVRVLAIIARSRTTKCPIRAGDNRIMHGSATAHTRTHYPNDSICLERRQCSAYVCVCPFYSTILSDQRNCRLRACWRNRNARQHNQACVHLNAPVRINTHTDMFR